MLKQKCDRIHSFAKLGVLGLTADMKYSNRNISEKVIWHFSTLEEHAKEVQGTRQKVGRHGGDKRVF